MNQSRTLSSELKWIEGSLSTTELKTLCRHHEIASKCYQTGAKELRSMASSVGGCNEKLCDLEQHRIQIGKKA